MQPSESRSIALPVVDIWSLVEICLVLVGDHGLAAREWERMDPLDALIFRPGDVKKAPLCMKEAEPSMRVSVRAFDEIPRGMVGVNVLTTSRIYGIANPNVSRVCGWKRWEKRKVFYWAYELGFWIACCSLYRKRD